MRKLLLTLLSAILIMSILSGCPKVTTEKKERAEKLERLEAELKELRKRGETLDILTGEK